MTKNYRIMNLLIAFLETFTSRKFLQPCASFLSANVCILYMAGHKVRTYKEYHSVCPSSELGLPPTRRLVCPPPPCFWGERNTRWRERGWESPNSDEGRPLWYSLYVRTLCGRNSTTQLSGLGCRYEDNRKESYYILSRN
jgi:hypothetical protein